MLADRVGLSQPEISNLERGKGATATIETWACAGAVVGLRLAAFFELAPGASLPRDNEHLKRQELLIRLAERGGWRALPEAPIDPDAARSRSIDLLLVRHLRRVTGRAEQPTGTQEFAVVEIWDLLDDVGAAFRGLEAKTAAVRRQHPRDIVTGVLVLRGTHRNRTLVAGFRGLFRARLGGSSAMALRSLTDSTCPLPHADVLLWTDVAGTCLIASRLGAAAARDGVPSSGAVQRTTLRT